MQQKGFYLYAVRSANHRGIFPEIKGIDRRGRVFTILVGDHMEAVVSLVTLKDFSVKEIQERAQNDLRWIKEKSLLHNEVIVKGTEGSEGMIIPMKFGTIFKTRQGLSKAMGRDSAKFLGLFQKLKGREEWSLKVYLNFDMLEGRIRENNAQIISQQDEVNSLTTGAAYFKEKELDDTLEKIKNLEVEKLIQNIIGSLSKFSEEEVIGKILDKELTMRDEPMILNAALLVSKKKLNKFWEELKKLQNALREHGLIIEPSGPWPPYNFI